uniref:Uncharacterized protein n=1 Tax=Oryza brachyantha TaxID=4533 RepID=J3MDH1_ORYBR
APFSLFPTRIESINSSARFSSKKEKKTASEKKKKRKKIPKPSRESRPKNRSEFIHPPCSNQETKKIQSSRHVSFRSLLVEPNRRNPQLLLVSSSDRAAVFCWIWSYLARPDRSLGFGGGSFHFGRLNYL